MANLILKKICLFWAPILFGIQGFSQANNTSQAQILFDRHQVDLHTGTPKIGIPLYVMATRSSKTAVSFSFDYHPLNISAYNKNIGDAGHGWTFSKSGGVIYRDVYNGLDEDRWSNPNSNNSSNIYEFHFLDRSGKFAIEKSGSQYNAVMVENKGDNLKIDAEIVNGKVHTFNIFDMDGYKYEFSVADSQDVVGSAGQTISVRTSFQLASIKDTNSKILASYVYQPAHYLLMGKNYDYHFLKSVISSGFGKAEFDLSLPGSLTANSRTRYTGMKVYDFSNNLVVKFDYDDVAGTLSKKAADNSQQEVYAFKYRESVLIGDGAGTVDYWGYPKGSSCSPSSPASSPDRLSASVGVLQQIVYPTGGSVIYDFEPHNYSATGNSYIGNGQQSFFENSNTLENRHNFTVNFKGSRIFSPGNQAPYTFTVTDAGYYYFKLEGEPYFDAKLGAMVYPSVNVRNDRSVILGRVNTGNANDNGCLGLRLNLAVGTYTITSNSLIPTSTLSIYALTLNTSVKRYWYGGGIRIKRIGFFDTGVIAGYYDALRPPLTKPVREIHYEYHIFNEPDRSSGHLREYYPGSDEFRGHSLVRYGNVTVRDSENNGKTEYTFISPLESGFWDDAKVGNLKKKWVYDSQNFLLAETMVDYEEYALLQPPVGLTFMPNHDISTGWIRPSNVLEKKFDSGNYLSLSKDTQYNGISRQLLSIVENTSIEGQTLSEVMYYSTANSQFSKNRSQIEKVERYKNGTLLQTKRIQYSNDWPILIYGGINSSYLPKIVEVSTGDGPFRKSYEITHYDGFGNVISYIDEKGMPVVNIWGYDSTLLVAQIENATLGEVPQNLVSAVRTASDSGSEADLLAVLATLRASTQLSNAFVTTQTYKPLVGVSTKTDPRGYRTTYQYDGFGRLSAVRDGSGKLLTEDMHHYRP